MRAHQVELQHAGVVIGNGQNIHLHIVLSAQFGQKKMSVCST